MKNIFKTPNAELYLDVISENTNLVNTPDEADLFYCHSLDIEIHIIAIRNHIKKNGILIILEVGPKDLEKIFLDVYGASFCGQHHVAVIYNTTQDKRNMSLHMESVQSSGSPKKRAQLAQKVLHNALNVRVAEKEKK